MEYKKDYKKIDDFKDSLKEVYSIVKKNILPYSIIFNSCYDKDSLIKLLDKNDYLTDFNDKHIEKICNEDDIYLLTHDGDFKQSSINIVSFNAVYDN